MSKFYGVLTIGRGGTKTARTSRAGDGYARAEISTDMHTFRLEALPNGDIALLRTPQRWKEANATPEGEWDLLYEDNIMPEYTPIEGDVP